MPVNAGAVAGVNVQRPQRGSARTNDVAARKARRRLGWLGGPARCQEKRGWLRHLVRLRKILRTARQ